MRLLVTGARGLVASRLCAAALRDGHALIAQSRTAGEGLTACDLGDEDQVRALVTRTAPEVIVNPSGMTDLDACERDPAGAWVANVVATHHLALAAREAGARFIQVSTDYVFDGEAGPYSEDDVPSPRGVYARSKYAAELLALTTAPNAVVARTAVVYGWPPASGRLNFGAWLLQKLSANERVKLFSDQTVSPTLAQSLAEMLLELAQRPEGGVWHLCGAQVVDRVQFGEKLCQVFGFDASLIEPTRLADATLLAPRPPKAGLLLGKAKALQHAPLRLDEALRRFQREWQSAAGAGG